MESKALQVFQQAKPAVFHRQNHTAIVLAANINHDRLPLTPPYASSLLRPAVRITSTRTLRRCSNQWFALISSTFRSLRIILLYILCFILTYLFGFERLRLDSLESIYILGFILLYPVGLMILSVLGFELLYRLISCSDGGRGTQSTEDYLDFGLFLIEPLDRLPQVVVRFSSFFFGYAVLVVLYCLV
ncbi:hypothetical protein KVT40_009235 [Elsinoe batatas]|uniref:Transmembrane protein n=1 Tax=Elsinoe batatas TaxID=2601811 RepID=A0A8K0PDC1_9PEZI|nr:hypothetical protein KVT40_009235 [Elsinoe batatas]